jgi:hypothetical protein
VEDSEWAGGAGRNSWNDFVAHGDATLNFKSQNSNSNEEIFQRIDHKRHKQERGSDFVGFF